MKNYELVRGIEEKKSCRVCKNSNLEMVISLGNQCIINFVDSPENKIFSAPLELVLCNKEKGGCGLLQLRHTVPADMLYRKFWYKSGVNQTMKDALKDIVENAEKLISLKENDFVVDIGANDGTLLRHYTKSNLNLIGFEPATNLFEEASKNTTKIINDYFTYDSFKKHFGNKKAKIITSIAMFYDLDVPESFVSDISKTLDKKGIWIIQMNYLPTMLENNTFDNISHEHLVYYSLKSLKFLLNKCGLEIFDVELNDINGGSVRTYIKHKDSENFQITNKVKETLEYENKIGLDGNEPYLQFAKRISELKNETVDFIKKEVKGGKKIYVYGASTRGNTLLQYYGLDHNLISAAADRNPIKWGKKIVGSQIPIISEEQARKENPDYFLVLPWHFLDEFKSREKEYLKKGGKFIVPLPKFQIIDSSY